MSSSALRYFLVHHPESASVLWEAIHSGEIDVAKAASQDPALLRDFLVAVAGMRSVSYGMEETHLAMAKLLEGQGLDLWCPVGAEDTKKPFQCALQTQNPHLIRWVGKHPGAPHDLIAQLESQGQSPLFNANVRVAKALLDVGFDSQVKDARGNNLLHTANSGELVTLWLAQGVDPRHKNLAGQDVKAAWDAHPNTPQTLRKEKDSALAQHVAPDPQQLVREFGKKAFEVGIPRSRERLAAAGLDPATATYQGFSMPEMVAIEALRRGFKVREYNPNEPIDHYRCRKLLLSALRSCGVPEANSVEHTRWQQILGFFMLMERSMQPKTRDVKTVKKRDAKGKKIEELSVDHTREEIAKIVGGSPGTTAAAFNHTQLLGKLVKLGLVDNGSMLAGHLLKAIAGDLGASLAQGNTTARAAFLHLAKMAACGAWEPAWNRPGSLQNNPLQNIPIPFALEKSLPADQEGIAALLSMLPKDPGRAFRELQDRLRGQALPSLSADDPWLAAGLKRVGSFVDPEIAQMVGEIRALATHAVLEETTAPSAARPGRRL